MNDVKKVRQHINSTRDRLIKPVLDDCPICGAKDQKTDIIAHGPGVGILGYECGCSVASKDGYPTVYRKYDGTAIYRDTND